MQFDPNLELLENSLLRQNRSGCVNDSFAAVLGQQIEARQPVAQRI